MDGVLGALRAFYGPLAPPPKELFAFFVWDVVLARLHGLAPGPKARVRRAARRHLMAACHGEHDGLVEAVVVLGHHAVHACGDVPHCTVCPLATGCHHAQRAAVSSTRPGDA